MIEAQPKRFNLKFELLKDLIYILLNYHVIELL